MSISGGPNIIKNGLVLYLDAADDSSYVSGSTVWKDISGNSNNGTLTNGPTYNSANKGSIVFDGSNDYVNIPFSVSTFPTGGMARTMCAFFNPSQTKGQEIFGLGGNGRDGGRTALYLYNGTIVVECRNIILQTPTSYSLNTWYQVAMTMPTGGTSTSIKIYVNGVQQSSSLVMGGDISIDTETGGCVIGSIPTVPTVEMLNGKVGCAQLYNRALSADEILQNFNSTKGRYNL